MADPQRPQPFSRAAIVVAVVAFLLLALVPVQCSESQYAPSIEAAAETTVPRLHAPAPRAAPIRERVEDTLSPVSHPAASSGNVDRRLWIHCDLSHLEPRTQRVSFVSWTFEGSPPPFFKDVELIEDDLAFVLPAHKSGSALLNDDDRDQGQIQIAWTATGEDGPVVCGVPTWSNGVTGVHVHLEGTPSPDATLVGCGHPVRTEGGREVYMTVAAAPCTLSTRIWRQGRKAVSPAVSLNPREGVDLEVTLPYPDPTQWTPFSSEDWDEINEAYRKLDLICSPEGIAQMGEDFGEDCAQIRRNAEEQTGRR